MLTEHGEVFDAAGQCCCAGCSAAFAAEAVNAAGTQENNGAGAPSGSASDYVDALINEYHFQWGSATPGTGATITYSFLSSLPNYYSSYSAEYASFAPMNAEQQDAVREILQMYSEIADVDFVEVNGVGSISFGGADLGTGIAGWAYYPYPAYDGPSDGTAFGDVWITTRYTAYSDPTVGTSTYSAFIHEIGHALGLKHPGNYDAGGGGTGGPYLPAGEDTQQYTVMSYHSGGNGTATPVTAQLYDIAALQYLYGANTATRIGDDIYNFSTTVQVKTIWDGGGSDTFDATNQLHAVSIDLHAGAFSSIAGTDNVAIAFGVVIEAAIGSNYNDILEANDAGSTLRGGLGDDTLIGGAGDDVLSGGAGGDTLTGGAGADRFVFDAVPLASGQETDLVRDYNRGGQTAFDAAEGDRLDLSSLLMAQYIGAGQTADVLVRAIKEPNGVALLQVDLDGITGGTNWTTIARLDGIAVGDTLDVILDSALPSVAIVVEQYTAPVQPPVQPAAPLNDDNVLDGTDGDDNIDGDAGNDIIRGFAGNDTLGGGVGDDQIVGGAGNDVIFGGDGNDSIGGNDGDDTIVGQDGNDMIGGDDGNDQINGGAGDDVIFGGAGDDVLGGGSGHDIIVGMDGRDLIFGEDGNDQANGGAGNDIMVGGAGDDIFGGGSGDDIIVGEDGSDSLFGEDGNDNLNGGAGNDAVVGGAGNDVVGGGLGDDIVVGNDGDDVIFGEAGNDRLNGGEGADIIIGGDGNDEVGGGAGDDDLNGGFGDDVLFGEDGNDTLNGSAGNDVLLGMAGNDIFAFTAGDGSDTIVDFEAGADHIWFYGTGLHSFAEVQSHASFNPSTGVTTIAYEGGSVTLNGVALSQLSANDFIFS